MEVLQESGVSNIFVNLGSDHPALIESWAWAHAENKKMPKIIICPHEMVALSAAHGYAEATGEPSAVIVHVDCGTQNLGGAVHNAARGRVPVLIIAGTSPTTQEGEMTGSRNESIHWIQDVFDQRGIVREYMKYSNEIRTGKNAKQLVQRALQISQSDPKGPVYLMASREVLEQEVEQNSVDNYGWEPISPSAIPPKKIEKMAMELVKAKNPLIVTSYLGRNEEAVHELIHLSERLAISVIESSPKNMNFPANHPMHLGYIWNEQEQYEHLAEADFILVLDSDVPWIPLVNRPSKDCQIYYIDIDPLKEKTPLWYIESEGFFKADTYIALQQLNTFLNQNDLIDTQATPKRYSEVEKKHKKLRTEWGKQEVSHDEITPQLLTACIREAIDEDAIIVNETITNFGVVSKHLPRTKANTLYGSGGSSLGWNGGASIGIKLANPEKLVVNLTGDGTYIFSNPTPVHWMSRKYNAPFLTVIYNNQGWGAPRLSTLGVHPEGKANEIDQFWVNFEPSSNLADIAQAAGGAYSRTVFNPDEIKDALKEAVKEVKKGRSAVLDVRLKNVSNQVV